MTRMIGAATMLERHGTRRGDTAWLAALLASPQAGIMVLIGDKPVIRSNAERTLAQIRWVAPDDIAALGFALDDAIFLGTEPGGGAGRFALQIREHYAAPMMAGEGPFGPVVDIRTLAAQGVMDAAELALIAQAKSLVSWADATRCCGRCGARMRPRDGGWRRQCTACATQQFPRLDPVVIMLVSDGERAVLAHEPRFPEGMLSTIAGYLEPGENVEHAVARETAEELGLAVRSVRYLATQPWPFPHSLMIGCIAETDTGEIRPDTEEIAFARWFTREEVEMIVERRHPEGFWVPGPVAIAHWLIRHWLEGRSLPEASALEDGRSTGRKDAT